LRKYFFFLALISILSCKNSNDKAQKDLSISTVTINLPFESSNYDDATNFTLYDSLGKKCVAELDTVTKGGGTIIYKDLQNGTYDYSITTIFDENIRKQVKIDSSVYIDFYNDLYDIKNEISLNSLRNAATIDLVIEIMNESDTSKVDAFKIQKNANKYLLKYNLNESSGWSRPYLVDSIKLIKAISEFETTVIGLREKNIIEENYGYRNATTVYFKCDNQFLEIWNLKRRHLKAAVRKLKQAIVKN
jgi:hypothetical protein